MVNDAVKTNKNILFDHVSQKEIINYMNILKIILIIYSHMLMIL